MVWGKPNVHMSITPTASEFEALRDDVESEKLAKDIIKILNRKKNGQRIP